MPNHIINQLTIHGPADRVAAMVQAFTTEEPFPDFETICPTSEDAKASHGQPGVYPRWYVERQELWGTKWNSYQNARQADNVFTFETAWSTPHPVFLEMSRQYPDLTLEVAFADEDTGYNCGCRTYLAGAVAHEHLPPKGSLEAYELAFSLRPDERRYYKLVDGAYVYDETADA